MREINGSCVERRLVKTYDDMDKRVMALRELGYTIGLTSGTWDLKHIGHERYLERLKEHVDIVVAGVDSDAKVKRRKGPDRPIVPESERVEALCHTRHVDLVFLKGADDEKWKLIRTVRPDVLLLSSRSEKGEEELAQLKKFCGEIMLIESQASTSASARIRLLHVSGIAEVKNRLDALFGELLGIDRNQDGRRD
jgi:D-beta-D-heptose 7-phosphate kinase/D-beta-D-heptose 1-phosphate adenosyltransferase